MMEKQEKKIEFKRSRIAVERKEDFMILTAGTSNMDDEVNVAHVLFPDVSLRELGTHIPRRMSRTTTSGDQDVTISNEHVGTATEESAATDEPPSTADPMSLVCFLLEIFCRT
jgi:hypothetical protein